MNSEIIRCPSCHTEIPLTTAVTSQVREELTREFAGKQRQLESTIRQKEEQLAQEKLRIDNAARDLETKVNERLALERQALLKQSREEVQAQLAVQMQDLRNQLNERADKLKEAQENELKLRQQARELEEKAEALHLEVARKVDEERGKIREDAKRQAAEEQQLRVAEKEKVISDLQKQIESLRQKAEQGSQQLQGEVLELNLLDLLKQAFPQDEIEPVATGSRGGDVLHRVKTNTGVECGTIIWEAKRTKNWGAAWTTKLKEDQRAAKAELAIIVSQCLPTEVKHFGQVDGVWVCEVGCALPVAAALRHGLINAAMVRLAESGKQGKMDELYGYLCGTEFRHHIEAIVESFAGLQEDLTKEKRAMEKIWASREKQILRAIKHTALLYGGIQGIAGRAALPEIEVLQLDTEKTRTQQPLLDNVQTTRE